MEFVAFRWIIAPQINRQDSRSRQIARSLFSVLNGRYLTLHGEDETPSFGNILGKKSGIPFSTGKIRPHRPGQNGTKGFFWQNRIPLMVFVHGKIYNVGDKRGRKTFLDVPPKNSSYRTYGNEQMCKRSRTMMPSLTPRRCLMKWAVQMSQYLISSELTT